jgi:hypothetical protein
MLIYKDGTVADYRTFFGNTSFPSTGPSDEFLAEHGAKKVSVFKPHNRDTEKLVPVDPYEEDGWVYIVAVEPKTPEEIQADQDSKAAQARAQRNQLLSDSDWTQVLDAPVDRTAWATYRQALRDISSQERFPSVIAWPSKPE